MCRFLLSIICHGTNKVRNCSCSVNTAVIANSWFQCRSYVTCSGFWLHSGWSFVWILFNTVRYPFRLCSICACAVQWTNLSIKHTCALYPPALVTLWVSYQKNSMGKSWRLPRNEHQCHETQSQHAVMIRGKRRLIMRDGGRTRWWSCGCHGFMYNR